MKAHARYEARARAWDESGRPAAQLLDGYDLIALRCWSWSAGAKVDLMSGTLRAFLAAASAAQPEDWLDAYFSEREACRGCGESYRFENLSLCTECSRTLCPRCVSQRERAANGNPSCACGEGELVG